VVQTFTRGCQSSHVSDMAADEAPRTCGRRGCENVEQGANAFLKCSRCKCTAYCSRECQKEDYCKGHSACAVTGVQAAAEAGPLTAGACKQVRLAIRVQIDECCNLLSPYISILHLHAA
jgi:hypothetical protein